MTPREVEELSEAEYHAFVRHMVDYGRAVDKASKRR